MLLLMWYTGLVTLQMKVCSEGIILYCCYFLMQCAQEICYQYWPGKSSETEKNGEFSVTMLEMVNRDGFVQRLISITDPILKQIVSLSPPGLTFQSSERIVLDSSANRS